MLSSRSRLASPSQLRSLLCEQGTSTGHLGQLPFAQVCMGLAMVFLSCQLEVYIAETHGIALKYTIPQEISDLNASKSFFFVFFLFSNLLSRRTLPKPEKDKHIGKPQPHCPQQRLGNALKGVDVSAMCSDTAYAPLLTCHYFTAKCFPAKYTRALSQSATVCTGIRTTVTVSVQLRKNSWVEGGSELPWREGQPHLTSGGKHSSAHPGWDFWSQISLGRKGWGRKMKVIFFVLLS